MNLSITTATEALEHYGIRVEHNAHATAGESITIAGISNADEKRISVSNATHSADRLIPLETAGAEYLALNYRGNHHKGRSPQADRMLEHLLIRVSEFFQHSGVEGFELSVRLHGNTYSVTGVTARASRALHFDKRLDAHAHDRKAEGLLSESATEPRR